jgi:serine/threonine-protein kinase RsbW
MHEVELRIASRREDVVGIADALDRFAARHGVSTALIHDLQVALDEVLGNVILHGYKEDPRGEILVRFQRAPDAFAIEVEDGGVPFDPLQAPPADLSAPLQQRRVGGLGVHFVKNLMDDVSYVRTDGRNRLRLVKRMSQN